MKKMILLMVSPLTLATDMFASVGISDEYGDAYSIGISQLIGDDKIPAMLEISSCISYAPSTLGIENQVGESSNVLSYYPGTLMSKIAGKVVLNFGSKSVLVGRTYSIIDSHDGIKREAGMVIGYKSMFGDSRSFQVNLGNMNHDTYLEFIASCALSKA